MKSIVPYKTEEQIEFQDLKPVFIERSSKILLRPTHRKSLYAQWTHLSAQKVAITARTGTRNLHYGVSRGKQ